MPKEKSIRTAKLASPYSRSQAEREAARRGEAAHRNPRETRRNQGPLIHATADPQIPAELWNGGRPSWDKPIATLRDDLIKAAGTDECCVADCTKNGDQIDHKVDWRTYLYNHIDPTTIKVPEGSWEGYLLEDVKRLYNDIKNLQLMCGSCNASKNGPKFYDRDRPTFTRN